MRPLDIELKHTMDSLSVILTTSPIPSHPSTRVLETCIDSLSYLGDLDCHFIIIFDGYKESVKEALKSGKISAKGIVNYEIYKNNVLEALCQKFHLDADHITQSCTHYQLRKDLIEIQIKQIPSRDKSRLFRLSLINICGTAIGFAHAVNCGLQFVDTPLVLVLQHDWIFVEEIPLKEILKEILANDEISYVTFPTKWNLRPYIWDESLDCNIPFKRLHFWYDRHHIAKVSRYKKLFDSFRFKRGYFIEDTFGQSMVADLKSCNSRKEFIERHRVYGTFMYDAGMSVCLRHMNGRRLVENLYFKDDL